MSIESTSILQYTQMMPYDKYGQKYVDTTPPPPLHINAKPLERDVQQAVSDVHKLLAIDSMLIIPHIVTCN